MNAADIKRHLKKAYNAQATAIAFEVAHGTGRHANRHVDAVVMELWPSRGLTLHAMEIKVSMSDLKRELRDGQKSEEIAQHCDFFSIVCPLGMCRDEKLPSAWGLIEVQRDGVLKIRKAAVKTKALAVDRPFMASMLRAISRKDAKAEVNALLEVERANMRHQIKSAVEAELAARDGDGSKWAKLEAAINALPGENRLGWYSDNEIIKAVTLVLRTKLVNNYDGIHKLVKTLGLNYELLKVAMLELKIGDTQ